MKKLLVIFLCFTFPLFSSHKNERKKDIETQIQQFFSGSENNNNQTPNFYIKDQKAFKKAFEKNDIKALQKICKENRFNMSTSPEKFDPSTPGFTSFMQELIKEKEKQTKTRNNESAKKDLRNGLGLVFISGIMLGLDIYSSFGCQEETGAAIASIIKNQFTTASVFGYGCLFLRRWWYNESAKKEYQEAKAKAFLANHTFAASAKESDE